MVGTGAENYASLVGQGGFQRRYFRVSTEAPAPAGFALIPAGNFQMGDQSNPLVGQSNERPAHQVQVSAFYMAKHEVTKQLWDEVLAWGLANGYTDLPTGAGKGANHPVHSINWYAMVKWCNARSAKENLVPCYHTNAAQTGAYTYKTGSVNIDNTMVNWSANGYRLPTEAEWEKAARGGQVGYNFPWGNAIQQSQATYGVYSADGISNSYTYDITPRPPATGTTFYHPAYNTGSTPYTAPVGSFAPEATYGLYDMSGNLYESCWDWYDTSYYGSSQGTDPRGPSSGVGRVYRGGCWSNSAFNSRVAYRIGDTPVYPYSIVGFRLARSSDP